VDEGARLEIAYPARDRGFKSLSLRPAPFKSYEIGVGGHSMYYVYIIRKCSNSELYIGFTTNLKRRFREHNTKNKCELIYYEAYKARKDAMLRE
jgi:hypothetical protein